MSETQKYNGIDMALEEQETCKTDRKLHGRDAVRIAVVTALYALIAFMSLGSLKAPQTAYTFKTDDSPTIFDLGRTCNFEMLFYQGIQQKNQDFI
ncbi:hypothetical protein RCJ22_14870, partial [Vibrio sp. FNV 38]|nr:hypothetical protein [Vibrio sp. FNV 38]